MISHRVKIGELKTRCRRLRVATRASKLALQQTEWLIAQLRESWPDLECELVEANPPGDRDKKTPLTSLGQGVFVKGIEELVLAGEADFAVHSLKDVPTQLTPGLELAAFPWRADPRDGLICRGGGALAALPTRARVATGSPRRAAQLLAMRSDVTIVPVRGNLDTRIRKLRSGEYDALVVAVAGLERLRRLDELDQAFGPDECTPAAGQGALAVQCRQDDAETRAYLTSIDDPVCRAEVLAERAFLAGLGGGCQLPAGALGRVRGSELDLIGVAAAPDGATVVRDRLTGPIGAAPDLGRALASRLLSQARGLLG